MRTLLPLLVLAGMLAGTPARADPPPDRPNILLLISDDQAWSTFDPALMPSVYGELVDRGMLFDRAYVASSLCCPSRSEILTGLYEHHTGVDTNPLPLTRPTIVEALHDVGYRTMLAGKYLNGAPCDPRPEFDRWICSSRAPSTYDLLNPWMNVDGIWQRLVGIAPQLQAKFVSSFIRSTPEGRPFFAMYAPTTPHLPANDPRYAGLAATPPRGASYDEETRTDGKPLYARRFPLTETQTSLIDDEYRAMARSVRGLDDDVATILSSLGDRERDTLVIYVSDNGYLYGQHRRSAKKAPYEESVRVPFIVRYPRSMGDAPSASDALVQNVDIAPTLADVVGIPWEADGRSLVPLLIGQASTVRKGALIERCLGDLGADSPCYGFSPSGATPDVPGFAGIVTETYKYVEYATGERELYDLSTDPSELANLAEDPGYRNVRARLAGQLADLLRSPPIETTIVTGPEGPVDARTVEFTYFSPDRFPTYRCRLTRDGVPGTWHACNGESEVEGSLADGDYVFEVAGVGERGALDPTPASRSFSIHSTGPTVTIDSGPAGHVLPGPVSFSFSSPAAGASFECKLERLGAEADWEPCDPAVAASYAKLKDGLWSFEVRATDPATGATTDPPAEALVRVDGAGPEMTFSARPPLSTRAASAAFRFAPDEATSGATACKLDSAPRESCSNGSFDAAGLSSGRHSLRVTATDELGNRGVSTFAWTVDRTAPAASIRSGPPRYSSASDPSFELDGAPHGGGYYCALDRGVRLICPPQVGLSGLPDGPHTLEVWAVDGGLNVSASVVRTWVQDTAPPVTTITSGPTDPASDTTATFVFAANEESVAFECSLDAAGSLPCASGVTYTGLALGPHTFAVHAVDAAGNVAVDATWTWTIA